MKATSPAVFLLLFLNFTIPRSSAQAIDRPPVLANFPFENSVPLKIVREAVPAKPFSVVGPRGAILGRQDGSFEAWIFPWKIFSNLRISAEMKDYPVPIDVNEQAAVIEVRPDHTTITYAHANFTIREVLFAPRNPPDGAGVLAFFEVEAIRPLTLTFQFTPEMKRMWPAPSDDRTFGDWVKTASGGFYLLHLNFPDHSAALEIPGEETGILPPYQERPKTYPSQFVVHFDPARDGNKLFPLLMATADTAEDGTKAAFDRKLASLERSFQSLYEQNAEYFKKFLNEHLSITTPDHQFDEAFLWAEVS